MLSLGFPGGASGKNPPANAGDMRRRFNPWVRKIPGGGHGKTLQYSCLEIPMDREAWRATVHRVAQNRTRLKHSAHASLTKFHSIF